MVLDASALLTLMHDEPGADRVEAALVGARVSAVNWAEVVQKALWLEVDSTWLREGIIDVGVVVEPFTVDQAEAAAHLWRRTRSHGLSLADRACLALAQDYQCPVLTADRAWHALDVGLEIELLR